MPLRACMKQHTHREYLTWLAWLGEQWNQPSRSDNYLMQIALRIQQAIESFRKRPRNVYLKEQRIEFRQEPAETKPVKEVPKPSADYAKSVWVARVGMKPETRQDGN